MLEMLQKWVTLRVFRAPRSVLRGMENNHITPYNKLFLRQRCLKPGGHTQSSPPICFINYTTHLFQNIIQSLTEILGMLLCGSELSKITVRREINPRRRRRNRRIGGRWRSFGDHWYPLSLSTSDRNERERERWIGYYPSKPSL